jgi:hypothetical protein
MEWATCSYQGWSPSIDVQGKPFSYASQSTDQIGVMYAPSATEITPEGYLYSGFGELMFYIGAERQPVVQRLRTLEARWLPIFHRAIAMPYNATRTNTRDGIAL